MSRRLISAMVVTFVALWGAGVPRFAHIMTAHWPQANASAGSCTHCCSQCSLQRVAGQSPANAPADNDDPCESTTSTDHSGCAVCELLATLVTNVPVQPAALAAWEPALDRVVESPAPIALQTAFDPHAARGPPLVLDIAI